MATGEAPVNLRRGTTRHRIAYISAGPQKSKLNLVCIHGWACQASDFTYLFTELLKDNDLNFELWAIDLPGHGHSYTKLYQQAGVEAFTQCVIDFIGKEMGMENVVLLGHSMSMKLVLETFLRLPESGKPHVSGLIFLDASHYKHRKSEFSFDSGSDISKTMSAEDKKAGMVEAFRTMFHPHHTPQAFRHSAEEHVRKMNLEYNEAMRRSFINYDYEHTDDSLATIGKKGVPVLNLQSTCVDEKNERVGLEKGERSRWMRHVEELVPQAKEVVVLEASHFPHVDQPEEVARAVREFIGGLGG